MSEETKKPKKDGPIIVEARWASAGVAAGAIDDPLSVRSLPQAPFEAAVSAIFILAWSVFPPWLLVGASQHLAAALPASGLSLGDAIQTLDIRTMKRGLVFLLALAGNILWLRYVIAAHLLPILKGGFLGKPCLFFDETGFLDRRRFREKIRWQDVKDIELWNGGKPPHFVRVKLRPESPQAGSVRRRTGRKRRNNIWIMEGPFGLNVGGSYPFLSAHFRAWKRKQKKAQQQKT